MKKLMAVIAGFMFVAFAADLYAFNVAFVDAEKAVKQYDGTKKITDKLKDDLAKEEEVLSKERDSIKAAYAELEKKSSIMDKKELAKKVEELKKREEKYQMAYLEAQQKLVTKQKEVMSGLMDEITAIVARIAKEKKYDFVFEKQAMLFGGDDITYLVIKEMNGK